MLSWTTLLILILPGAALVALLLGLLQKKLRIFTRGTVAFMALVVAVTTALSLLSVGNDIRNTESRYSLSRQRSLAFNALTPFCETVFDASWYSSSTSREYDRSFLSDCRQARQSFELFLSDDHPLKATDRDRLTTRAVAMKLDATPQWGIGNNDFQIWDFKVLVHVIEEGRPSVPDVIVNGFFILSHEGRQVEWRVSGLNRVTQDTVSSEESARLFYEADGRDPKLKVKRGWSSKNPYAHGRYGYQWKN